MLEKNGNDKNQEGFTISIFNIPILRLFELNKYIWMDLNKGNNLI